MKKMMVRSCVALSAIGMAVASAPAAFAGTDARAETSGAWAYFGAYDEILKVQDTNGTDNASARAQIQWGGAVRATIWASGGGATNSLDMEIAEGQGINLQVCRVVKSTGYVYNCSSWEYGIA